MIFKIRSVKFVIFVVSFMIVTTLVHFGVLNHTDQIILNYLNIEAMNNSGVYALIVISSLGEVVNIILISIVFTIIRRTRKMGLILMITIVIVIILTGYVKPLIGHVKPPGLKYLPTLPKGYNMENDTVVPFAAIFSYPSNHLGSTTTFSYILGYFTLKKFKTGGYLIWAYPVIVGMAQISLHQYYFSDALGGFLIGIIISTITSDILKLEIPFSLEKFKKK